MDEKRAEHTGNFFERNWRFFQDEYAKANNHIEALEDFEKDIPESDHPQKQLLKEAASVAKTVQQERRKNAEWAKNKFEYLTNQFFGDLDNG